MPTLDQINTAQRERLESLADALDHRATDLNSLLSVLAAFRDFGGGDPLPHLRAAMRCYLGKDDQHEN